MGIPWPAMWDTCFQAKVATLADISLAKHDLNLFLSDRWQTKTGHIPNVEWDLMGETPPLFAWAAWQIYQADGDRAFLETVFPQLESHYAYVRKAYDRDKDALHTGGFMGMDNIPRPGNPNEEEADLSGWVAFFAQDMQRIAAELGKTDRANFYQTQYQTISATINEQLWDVETGFYYDRNDKRLPDGEILRRIDTLHCRRQHPRPNRRHPGNAQRPNAVLVRVWRPQPVCSV